MRTLLATTCLTPLALIAAAGQAETVISTARTTPIATATATGSAPDDVRIAAEGSIVLTAAGPAVTLNSANSITNAGAITFSNVNDATGILTAAGGAGAIVNSGKITIDETYAPTDADTDGDIDGPFASGAGRFGIRTGGDFAGAITSSGAIAIEGNDSGGILLGGTLTGTLTNSGTITVLGDRAVGIKTGAVVGDVKLTGTITAQGVQATGVAIDGDVTGAFVVQGTVNSTGYRTTAPPADTSKLDADDLLQGGPAVRIAGNVAGGVLVDAPPRDTDPANLDEDKDGTPDAQETTGAINSFGAAPAMQIGAADRAVTIGAVAGNANGHGLVVNGTVTGTGAYAGVAGNGVVIGGLGGVTSIAGGATVNGTIGASASGADAIAFRVGTGATVAEIRNAGTIGAAGGNATTSARGIVVDAGGRVDAIRNAGAIRATTTADGSAFAIVDRAGTVALVENSGAIAATGATGTTAAGRNVAIDLSIRTGDTVVRQTTVAAGVTPPTITGDINFGAGNNLLEVADGGVSGTTRFGNGANRVLLSGDALYVGGVTFGNGADTLSLAGTSAFAGTADFGGGADRLTIGDTATFTGNLVNSGAVAVTVTGGALDVVNSGSVAIGSLAVGATGSITVNVDGKADTNTLYQVAGTADFATGAKIVVRLANVTDAEGRYTFLRAGTLTGAAGLQTTGATLPFMFTSSLATNTPANELALDIRRRTATELELNGSEGRAYDAVYTALDADAKVASVYLGILDGEAFRSTLRRMLPDHAGGTFDAVTQGSRASARFLADPNAPFADRGNWGLILQQFAWGNTKSIGDTAGYDVSGWGTTAGLEARTDNVGAFGVTASYMHGKDADDGTDNDVTDSQYEAAIYWRGSFGGFRANARASAAHIGFEGSRTFGGTIGSEAVTRIARSDWDGRLISGSGGIAYEFRSGRLTVRPGAAIDYYRLQEDAHTDTGGGKAFDLIVDERTSDELAASATIAAGLNFGGTDPDTGWFRTEIEGGRRQIVGGSLGATTARFEGGEAFTLVPEDRTDGWIGKLRLTGGTSDFTVGGEFNAEEQRSRVAVALRAYLRFGF